MGRSLPGHAMPTLTYASGVVFHAGLRTVEQARVRGRDGMLATAGIGPRTAPAIESLWAVLSRGAGAND